MDESNDISIQTDCSATLASNTDVKLISCWPRRRDHSIEH